MSTDYGYACVSHDPPLHSECDLNHGFDLLLDALIRMRAGTWPARADGFGGVEHQSILTRGGTEYREPIYFLLRHPRCRIAIVDEYGTVWLTDDGPLQVSGPDERTHRKCPPNVPIGERVELVPGVYPPVGEARCTCVTPVLAVPQSMARPDYWVRCATCGGTSLPGERES